MKRILIVLLCVLSANVLFAEGKISGNVEAKDGTPLVGVNVILKGTNLGASTDADGNYTIANVPVGDYTIIASAIGYKTGKDAIGVTEGVCDSLYISS